MLSCLYEGRVQHVRQEPVEHRFSYRLAMAYLDLSEIEELVGSQGVLSSSRFAPASFLESDHRLAGTEAAVSPSSESTDSLSLAAAVRDFIAKSTGDRPIGPIRVLTQLRYFGHYFSPLNLFYCFEADGEQLASLVAEVSNTPWGERHLYVLHAGNQLTSARVHRYQHAKSFHVSPFMGMNASYEWRLNSPGRVLAASIESVRDGKAFFRANLALRRRGLSRRGVRSMLFRYPLMNTRVLAAIYWQALLLWKKRCPYFPHP